MADDGSRMTISEHFEELRSRILRSLAAAFVGFGFAFWRIDDVWAFLRRPLERFAEDHPGAANMIQTRPQDAFLSSMKMAFFAGCVLAAPVIIHQIWAFVSAGLFQHEKKVVKWYALPGLLLFFAGVGMGYLFILPWALEFLIAFADDLEVASFLTLSEYASLVSWTLFIFGLTFQLPLIMVFLMRIGVVAPATFRRFRRHAVVTVFAVAMVLTPPDPVSQIALAVSMLALYEGALLVGDRVARERQPPDES